MSGKKGGASAAAAITRTQSQQETPKQQYYYEDDEEEKPKESNNTVAWRIITTACYYASFIAYGFANGSMGLTVPYISRNTRVSLASAGYVFTSRAIGALFGSTIAGSMFDSCRGLPSHYVLLFSCLIMVGTWILIPLVPVFWIVVLLFFLMGIGGGAIDNGSNVMISWVWSHKPDKIVAFLQALHSCFGIGAFIAPIVISNLSKFIYFNVLKNTGDYKPSTTFSLRVVYWTLSVFMVLVLLAFIILKSPTAPPSQQKKRMKRRKQNIQIQSEYSRLSDDVEDNVIDSETGAYYQAGDETFSLSPRSKRKRSSKNQEPGVFRRSRTQNIITEILEYDELEAKKKVLDKKLYFLQIFSTLLISLFLALYSGLEVGFGGWIYTYATKDPASSHAASSGVIMTETEGAYLVSGFYGAFSFFRLLAIFIALFLNPKAMIFLDIVSCGFSLVVLLGTYYIPSIFHSVHESDLLIRILLWIGSIWYGLSLASMYPSAVAFIGYLGFPITGAAYSALNIGGTSGESLLPVTIGYLMTGFGKVSLMWSEVALLIGILFFLVCLAVVQIFVKRLRNQQQELLESAQQEE